MITRRSFLNGMMTSASGLALTAAGLPLSARAQDAPGQPLTTLLGQFFDEDSPIANPERATTLGVDKGEMAGFGAPTDRPLAGRSRRQQAATADQLNRLRRSTALRSRASKPSITIASPMCWNRRDHVNKRYDFGAPWDAHPMW